MRTTHDQTYTLKREELIEAVRKHCKIDEKAITMYFDVDNNGDNSVLKVRTHDEES